MIHFFFLGLNTWTNSLAKFSSMDLWKTSFISAFITVFPKALLFFCVLQTM